MSKIKTTALSTLFAVQTLFGIGCKEKPEFHKSIEAREAETGAFLPGELHSAKDETNTKGADIRAFETGADVPKLKSDTAISQLNDSAQNATNKHHQPRQPY